MNSRILIVDDTEVNRKLIGRYLKKHDYQLIMAGGGQAAIDILEAQQSDDPIDLVLLDIMMPEKNGFDVLQHMRQQKHLRHIPVIVVSALDDRPAVIRSIELGADDFLFKPIDKVLLQARIKSLLEKKWLYEREIHNLREINRLKDEFLRMATHDLKNPISIIIGYVDLLREGEYITEPDARGFLDKIKSSTEKMLTLIGDLLNLARIEAGVELQRRLINLDDLISDSISDLYFPAQQKEITLEYNPSEQNIQIEVDPRRFNQVINNLVSNAIKYTPEQGQIQITAQPEDNAIMIAVSDTGPGIDEKELPKIFDRFYRLQQHQDMEGTGLGLAIVKAIVEQHDGQVWVESVTGQGSKFYVQIPQT